MSSMLEQAIVDAQALREAALKNAEQALIEKFAPQIKDAVESLLEEGASAPAKKQVSYEGKNHSLLEIDGIKATIQFENMKPFVVETTELGEALLQEEEGMAMGGGSEMGAGNIEAPFAGNPMNDDRSVEMTMEVPSDEFILDLDTIKAELAGEADAPESSLEGPKELLGDLDLGGEDTPADEGGELDLGVELQEEKEEDEDALVQEIMNLMNEMYEEDVEVIEEKLTVDMGQEKTGYNETFGPTLQYEMEMEMAKGTTMEMLMEMARIQRKLQRTRKLRLLRPALLLRLPPS